LEVIGAQRARTELANLYLRVRPGERILDIGCGPADILTYLPQVEYVGFDISPKYIEAARQRFSQRGEFHCQEVNATSLSQFQAFDVVNACGIVHHLDDAAAVHLFEIARAALKPTGRLVTFDGCYVPGQSRMARYLLSRDRGEYVRTEEQYVSLARQVFPRVSVHLRHDLLRIPYTHIILECSAAETEEGRANHESTK
jgi:cyclopropane fatty-acyl-phospholipid synthase-like methyltransferase